MKKRIDLNTVTGDENLVTANETYVALDGAGKITALKKRNASGELAVVVDEHVNQYVLENKKTATKSLAELKEGDVITVTPSSGKDGMKKVEITITA